VKYTKYVGLFAVLAALAVAVVVQKIFERGRVAVERRAKEQESVSVVTQDLSPEEIDMVLIYKGAEPDRRIELKKDEKGAWVIWNLLAMRARDNTVPEILKKFSGLKGMVRSASASLFSDFKIADTDGVHVVFADAGGGELAHVVMGEVLPRKDAYFVRRSDSEKVVSVERENLSGSLGLARPGNPLDDRFFRDNRLFLPEVRDVRRFEIVRPPEEACVFAKSDVWKLESPAGGGTAVSRKIDDYLEALSGLTILDIVDPQGPGYGLEPPQAAIKLDIPGADGVGTVEVQMGGPAEKESGRYVRVLPVGHVYKISRAAAGRLARRRADFLLPDVGNVTRFEIIFPPEEACVFVKSGTWRLEPPDGRAIIDSGKIEEHLGVILGILGCEAEDVSRDFRGGFPGGPRDFLYGLEPPRAAVKLTLQEDAPRVLEFQLGRSIEDEETFYVRVLPSRAIYRVSGDAALRLRAGRADFVRSRSQKK